MSAVTNVVLCTSVVEAPGDSSKLGPNWDRVQAWLVERMFDRLSIIEEAMASTKAAEMLVGAKVYNHFPYEEFITFVRALPWEEPSNVVLVVQPQEGETLVFRPSAR